MIIEALLRLFEGLLDFITDLMGNAPAPGWLTSLSGQLSSVVDLGASMGSWVPWSALGAALAAILLCYGISFVVFVVRMGISLFTGGGGKA